MSVKEYVVSLQKGVDYDQFWSEMESNTNGLEFVPNRIVDIVNNRDGSTRNCHYALTPEEAQLLRDDPRVLGVDIPVSQKDYVQIKRFQTTQLGNFTKPSSQSDSNNSYLNWGLIRHTANTNVYGTSQSTSLNYLYDFDGTGVDVVIHDSGLQIDHPEFTDANGASRVQQINWYTASGISGTQSANHYRDYAGHGTHVAGIAAGKTYGWAKNARIYSVKVRGLEGSGDAGTGIAAVDCMDVVKLWHRNKPVDPITGHKRPTIVNMSWGYTAPYSSITGGRYRGTTWSGSTADINKGMFSSRSSSYRDTATDVDLEELLDEGVIVCIAAGNNSHKVDVIGGVDYNNYWTYGGVENIYYHRGCSPYSTKAIIVGSLNNAPYNSNLDVKASYSNGGPGVDIYGAGTYIMSSTSNVNEFPIGSYIDYPYYANTSFKQINLTGTSMASPQICGIGALYLQNNVTANSSVLKSIIQGNGTYTIYNTGLDNDYSVTSSQWGGNVKVAYINTLTSNSSSNIANSTIANTAIWSGKGGFASVNFTRTPPPVARSKNRTILILATTYPGDIQPYTTLAPIIRQQANNLGYTTTIVNSLPANINTYAQVWDINYNSRLGLAADNSAYSAVAAKYLSYLQSGGGLFLLGENGNFTTRDNDISTFMNSVGGGTVTIYPDYLAEAQTIASEFLIVNNTPSVYYPAASYFSSRGTGTVMTSGTGPVAVCWKTGSLTNASAGAVVSILDVNFLSSQFDFIDNVISTIRAK
jgi:hypothetical protein